MASQFAFTSATTSTSDPTAHPAHIRHNDVTRSSSTDVTTVTDVTNNDTGGSSISDVTTALRSDDVIAAKRPKIWSMAEIATSKTKEDERRDEREDVDSRDGSPSPTSHPSSHAAVSSLMAAAQLSAAAAAAQQHPGKLPVGGPAHAHLLHPAWRTATHPYLHAAQMHLHSRLAALAHHQQEQHKTPPRIPHNPFLPHFRSAAFQQQQRLGGSGSAFAPIPTSLSKSGN